MKKIALIKVGKTFDFILARQGDFEDWVISGMGVGRAECSIIDVCNGDPLPACREVSGIVITGSHEMITEHRDWSEQTAGWLPEAVAGNIPILGICYGHHMLAYAMGGEVGDNPRGREFGVVEVNLTPQSKGDILLGGLPPSLNLYACHSQSVLMLPPKALLLASSKMDPYHAFVLGKCAWGFQFHPELNASIAIEYIKTYREELKAEGQDPDALIGKCVETPWGKRLFRSFARVFRER